MKEIVKTISDFLKNGDHPIIEMNFKEVICGIKLLQKDENIENLDRIIFDSIKIIKDQMDFISDDMPLTPEYLEFVICLCKLMYNFNNNTFEKNLELETLCKFLNKSCELIKFTKIVIDIEKTANIRLQEWRNFNPPAFSVSKSLLMEVLNDE
jgi:hypothetical protein